MKTTKLKINFGFTLLELLIVIVILGTLATFVIIRLTGGEKSARDARRRSDLRQYQTVIEAYKSSRIFPVEFGFKGQPLFAQTFHLALVRKILKVLHPFITI